MSGATDPGSRGAFDWNGDPTRHRTFKLVAQLTALRRQTPALVTGEWRPLVSTEQVLAFTRGSGTRRVGVFINRGRKTRVAMAGLDKVIFGDAAVDEKQITLPARSAAIVKLGPRTVKAVAKS